MRGGPLPLLSSSLLVRRHIAPGWLYITQAPLTKEGRGAADASIKTLAPALIRLRPTAVIASDQ
jgi:hypothetical protein